MSRRIEVELTSNTGDGTWTWRAAGAKQPKGVLAESLLYADAAVGDICKVEADFLLDGIEITEVFVPKAKKARTDLLEMKPRELRDDELVSTTRVARPERSGRDRDRKGGRDGRKNDRGDRNRGGRSDSERRPRQPEPEPKPKPKRLRPKRVHRDEVLAAVPEEHRPIAEQVMKGGMQAVRAAIDAQNAQAKEAGTPEIAVKPVVAIAEDLVPKLRAAEWHDRADAAIADLDEIDLRDLRSVVVAADGARGDEATALAETLRNGLNRRVESDHEAWLNELREAASSGRSVRALRMSSRPVKAGAPLPPDLAAKLTEMATAGLTADTGQDRWATVIDAVAFSPVRNSVTPQGIPAEPKEELLEAVRRVADRVPAIAALFGIDPSEAAKAKRRRPPRKKKAEKAEKSEKSEKPRQAKPKVERPVPGAEKKSEPEAAAEPVAAPAADGDGPRPEAATEPDAAPQAATEPDAAPQAATEPDAAPQAATEPEVATEVPAELEAPEVPAELEAPEVPAELEAVHEAAPEAATEPQREVEVETSTGEVVEESTNED